MKPRDYQVKAINNINQCWSDGYKNVLLVMPVGSGKTFTFAEILSAHSGSSCAIAHRQELVSQISSALARDNIRHKIIGPKDVIKLCVNQHVREFGKSFYDPNAQCAVASIDTLIRREKQLATWCKTVTKWVIDECHHVQRKNKWGKGLAMFPNAVGLGVTATPLRADGNGLGSDNDGLFDIMVEGPPMRELINRGYLSDYRIFTPKSDIDTSDVAVSRVTGDFNPKTLSTAVSKSHIVGDVVDEYIKYANGKLGITFTTSIETSNDMVEAFIQRGVPAASVSSKTKNSDRIEIIEKFKNRKLLQLVNYDIFGEGFDLPAIECVSFARPTASYGLYVQQFGRALRSLHGKTHAIIIDHVGNVVDRHGLPDMPRQWTLDRRERRSSSAPTDAIPLKSCPQCTSPYERVFNTCPYCGFKPIPVERDGPKQVDGDLVEISPDMLATMRGDIIHFDRDQSVVCNEMNDKYAPRIAILTAMKRQRENIEMQTALRESISWWAGDWRSKGASDSEIYKRFYFKFGIDVLSAQVLKRKDALTLANKINEDLTL